MRAFFSFGLTDTQIEPERKIITPTLVGPIPSTLERLDTNSRIGEMLSVEISAFAAYLSDVPW